MVGDRPIELDLAVGVHQDRAHIHVERMAQVNPHEFVRAVSDFIEDYLAGPNQILEPYEQVDCPDEVEAPDDAPPLKVTPSSDLGLPKPQKHSPAASREHHPTALPFSGKCPICCEPMVSESQLERHKARKHAA